MTTLLFSDTHFTPEFSPQLCKLIISLVAKADRVVIHGDFWDAYLTNFEDFLDSPWKVMFPLLKKKHTVYVYGNHDLPQYADKRVGWFSEVTTNQYLMEFSQYKATIMHGHTLLPAFDGRHPWASRVLGNFYFLLVFLHRANLFFLSVLYRSYIARQNLAINTALWRYAEQLPPSHVLIAGHSHIQTASPSQKYYNTGATDVGTFQYGLATKAGISLYTSSW